MDSFLKAVIDKLPAWSFHAFAGLIAMGICLYFYKNFFIQKKFNDLVSDSLKKDDRVKNLQDIIDSLREEKNQKTAISSQLTTTLINVRQYVDALNTLRSENDLNFIFGNTEILIQRLLDVIAFDIKSISGERHRAGIWLLTENSLCLRYASAGFPSSYIGNRQLNIHRSIAGRCIRKDVVIYCPDVTKDEDYEKNEESKSPYKSLICIPFGSWGVLTIDGLEPMNEECKLIGELYASIIDGIMNEHLRAFVELSDTQDTVIDIEDDEEAV